MALDGARSPPKKTDWPDRHFAVGQAKHAFLLVKWCLEDPDITLGAAMRAFVPRRATAPPGSVHFKNINNAYLRPLFGYVPVSA